MNSSFKETLSFFTGIIKEYKGLKKSEIFRRIYKLPLKPLAGKRLSDAEACIKEAVVNGIFTQDEIEKMYNNWNNGLEYFGHEVFKKIVESMENIFIKENPGWEYDKYDETGKEKKREKSKLSEAEQKEYKEALEKYNDMTLNLDDLHTREYIQQQYEEKIRQIDESYNFRKSFTSYVFKGNSGKFAAMMRAKFKRNAMTQAERNRADKWALDQGYEEQELIDTLETCHTDKTSRLAKKQARQLRDQELMKNDNFYKEIQKLDKIINKYKGK